MESFPFRGIARTRSCAGPFSILISHPSASVRGSLRSGRSGRHPQPLARLQTPDSGRQALLAKAFGVLRSWSHLFLKIPVPGNDYYFHLTDVETEALKGEVAQRWKTKKQKARIGAQTFFPKLFEKDSVTRVVWRKKERTKRDVFHLKKKAGEELTAAVFMSDSNTGNTSISNLAKYRTLLDNW